MVNMKTLLLDLVNSIQQQMKKSYTPYYQTIGFRIRLTFNEGITSQRRAEIYNNFQPVCKQVGFYNVSNGLRYNTLPIKKYMIRDVLNIFSH
jgi:uncharacterized protein YggL (DUF469 family)